MSRLRNAASTVQRRSSITRSGTARCKAHPTEAEILAGAERSSVPLRCLPVDPARGTARSRDLNVDPESPIDSARRNLLRDCGMLVIGLSLAGCLPGRPAPVGRPPLRHPTACASPRPARLDATLIDTWLAIHTDNTATLYLGFAELGQVPPPRCCRLPPRSWI